MSLVMYLGRRGSLLSQRPTGRPLLRIEQPVLLAEEMAGLRCAAEFPAVTLSAVFDASAGPGALNSALDRVCDEAARAARRGTALLIVSDREADAERASIPMLLAVGAVHQHLLASGLRTRVGLVAEAGDAWDVHHFAALFGYGAEAVHPWLALEALETLEGAPDARPSPEKFRSAAQIGLLKILSKMGIATLQSYVGAQIFEALGVGPDVMERCFAGTASVLGGIGFQEIAEDVLARHAAAYEPDGASATRALPDHGRIRFRKDGEDHGWSPPIVRAMQDATRAGNSAGYGAFLARVESRPPAGPRDLVAFRRGDAVPLDDVEPAEVIRRRFISSAMSLGALSPEAHATLAAGMNRIDARSNSGEGGEDPATYVPAENGDRTDNRIKTGGFGAVLASRPITWSAPTSWRSRSRRARSPVKVASCRATR